MKYNISGTGRRTHGGHLEVIEDLQHSSQRAGLGLTAEWAILAVLIGQLWQTLPWRPEEMEKMHLISVYNSL